MVQRQVSVGAVIFRREGALPVYLLLRYVEGHWEFVKGHVEAGETHLQTLRRECQEETGITDLAVMPGFEREIAYFFRRRGDLISKSVIYFLAETHTAEVALSHEHQGFQWLAYGPARELLTFDNAKQVLDAADEKVKGLLRQRTLDS